MKKVILIGIVLLLFDGCSYKNKIYKDDFQKKVETNRKNCTDKYAVYNADNSSVFLKEKCELTYDGFHTQIYDQYEFSTGNYIAGSILLPIIGVVGSPVMLMDSLLNTDLEPIKTDFLMISYPISAPFYRLKGENEYSAYIFNKKKRNYEAEELLVFKDTVNIFPDKEIWIGDNKHKYPLQLNDNLSYHIPRDLVHYFCAQNYDDCNLTLYQRDDDTFTKFTTVKFYK
jgi:hypothetical protein